MFGLNTITDCSIVSSCFYNEVFGKRLLMVASMRNCFGTVLCVQQSILEFN